MLESVDMRSNHSFEVIMKTVPECYQPFMKYAVDAARQTLQEGLQHQPMGLVGNLGKKALIPVMMNFPDTQAKDAASEQLKVIANLIDADFLIFISECWSLEEADLTNYKKIIEEYGSFEAFPNRVDTMMFSLETNYGNWIGMTPIKKVGNSEKKRTFDDPSFWKSPHIEGRFTHILPSVQGKGYSTLN